ncbi:MAG TPA: proline dehydrogenase family protein [Acidimicrobiia bacterium]|nr:proline dehydrogenase family protein [Acidimicrobiia bacterium]
MSLFSRLVVGTAESPPIQRLITRTRAGRQLAQRFVAGETLDQAAEVARRLNRSRMAVSLDLLGEEVTSPDEVEQAYKGYEECLRRIADDDLDANISVKLTQLGLAIDQSLATQTLDRLAAVARDLGLSITIDMEDSRYTAATVDLYRATQELRGNLGLALQAYLYRTPADVNSLVGLGGHLRLCKGAYVENRDVAFTDRDDVDAAFVRLVEMLMAANQVMVAVATHDPKLIEVTRRLAHSRSGQFEFQMLYGVRTTAQRELSAAGYPLRIYLPYGSHWYPYLVRRLGERPANLALFLRALVGG